MDAAEIIAGVVGVALILYLTYALLFQEKFSTHYPYCKGRC